MTSTDRLSLILRRLDEIERFFPKRVRPRKRKTEQVRLAVGPPELFQSLSR